jgi:hypothetical protein
MIALNWFVLPARAYRELGFSVRDYLRSILAPWLLAAAALGCFGVWLNVTFPTTSWSVLSVKVIALCGAYLPIGLVAGAALFNSDETAEQGPDGVLVK